MRKILVLLSMLGILCLPVGVASDLVGALKGCWVVKRELKTPGIVGISQKEIDRIIGTRILYSGSLAKAGQIVLSAPDYETTTLSKQEFFDYAQFSPEKVGIPGPTVTQVSLKGAETLRTRFVGSRVFLGGKNPVIEVEGVFFELEKLSITPDEPGCNAKIRAHRPK